MSHEGNNEGLEKNENSELILNFYLGTGTDHKGRKLAQIVQKSDRWLEDTHDYIQWLFPLYVGSDFNPNAPLLTDDVRSTFCDPLYPNYPLLQQNFKSAIYRMLVFYGYSFSHLAPTKVEPTLEWKDKAANWITDGNHNFMRITRMLRSMALLGRGPLSRSFHTCLISAARVHPTVISNRTLAYWEEAVSPVSAY